MFEKNIFETNLATLNFFHFKKALFKKFFLEKIAIDFPSKKID